MIKNKIINGDCIEVLKTLPDGIVNTCVTSPPYFGLRDYGTATWEGGDINCDHIEKFQKHGGERSNRDQTSQIFQAQKVCKKCGAVRVDKQIGLEETPEAYVQRLVEVFREVKRVLRDDGTLWLNLGDSYAGSGGSGNQFNQLEKDGFNKYKQKGMPIGLKPKDLIGIPWRVAFALQADGWYLRQDIIWHKPNPMPESVTDRCTKSHEYIFLLSKSAKYYYDSDAIREPLAASTQNDPRMQDMGRTYNGKGRGAYGEIGKANGSMEAWTLNPNGSNKRSVWTVTTKPFSEAHFATFPKDLIRPCIRAGCPANGIVIDPFIGSGTTACVCIEENRNYLGIELNHKYIKIAENRIGSTERAGLIDFGEEE